MEQSFGGQGGKGAGLDIVLVVWKESVTIQVHLPRIKIKNLRNYRWLNQNRFGTRSFQKGLWLKFQGNQIVGTLFKGKSFICSLSSIPSPPPCGPSLGAEVREFCHKKQENSTTDLSVKRKDLKRKTAAWPHEVYKIQSLPKMHLERYEDPLWWCSREGHMAARKAFLSYMST
ncbi:hypothetical protein [Desulfoplanes sp.]